MFSTNIQTLDESTNSTAIAFSNKMLNNRSDSRKMERATILSLHELKSLFDLILNDVVFTSLTLTS